MKYYKTALFLIPWLAVCTYGSSWVMYHRPPLPGAWVLAGLVGLIYLVTGRAMDYRRSKR